MYGNPYYKPYWKSDELEHYGILGMKWGVRRTPEQLGHTRPTKQERKELKEKKRHVAAAKRNLRWKGDTVKDSEREIFYAKENYAMASVKPALFRKNRLARIKKAGERLTEAFEIGERPRADLNRAEEIYDKAAKEMWDYNNSLIEKYGSTKVKSLQTKTMEFGITNEREGVFTKEYTAIVKDVLKTGPTVANIPFYGQYYTGKYIAPYEIAAREEEFNKAAKKRY